jgi:hypothetical protein
MDTFSESKDRVGKGLERLENPDIKQSNSHLKLAPKYFEISWQTYRIAAFIFFGLSFAIMKYIVDYFTVNIDEPELINILKIISFFFILNFGTFLFINVYYKYRKSMKGITGPKGNEGKRGPQGSTSYCNICETKTGGFKREYKNKPMKEEVAPSLLLSFDKNTKPYWKLLDHTIKIGGITFRLMTPSFLGPGKPILAEYLDPDPKYPSDSDLNKTKIQNKDPFVTQVKPIIGVSASYNKNSGELYSIMFFKDKNKVHNSNRYKYTPLGVTIGKQTKSGVGIEFKCPKNTAIHKVELFHNSSIIVSLRLYCANVETGDAVMVLDPLSNKMRKYATIGKPVSKDDKLYTREIVEAGHFISGGNFYQSFLSQVAAKVDADSQQIYSLGFLQSSIFMKGFSLK